MEQKATWDEKLIRAWLKEASDTLRRLPGGYVRSHRTAWPEVVQKSSDPHGKYNCSGRQAAPTPHAIDRMERVLIWMLACRDEERRIIWARACGISWRRIEDIDGRSHVTLRKVESRGVRSIHRYLRAHPDLAPTG